MRTDNRNIDAFSNLEGAIALIQRRKSLQVDKDGCPGFHKDKRAKQVKTIESHVSHGDTYLKLLSPETLERYKRQNEGERNQPPPS